MKLVEYARQIRNGTPGRRFQQFHVHRCQLRGAQKWPRERLITLGLGTLLLAGGIAIGWLPGPGGFIAFLGLALLGVEWMWVAKALDWTEARIREGFGWIKGLFRRTQRAAGPSSRKSHSRGPRPG